MAKPGGYMDPLAAVFSDDDSDGEHEATPTNRATDTNAPAAPAGLPAGNKESINYEDLERNGFKGGPSILFVPHAKPGAGPSDYSWSKGEKRKADSDDEDREDRARTSAAANESTNEAAAQALAFNAMAKKQRQDAAAERRDLSVAQREKRKRDLGQASRGKNYVEEEKRALRNSGVYSGFD